MDKHVGWFVVELEQRLNGRLHPRESQSVVREIETHLEESAAELGSSATAVEAFGSPSELAHELLEARNPAFRPSGKAANVAIACAAIIALVPVLGFFWSALGDSWFAIVLPLFA